MPQFKSLEDLNDEKIQRQLESVKRHGGWIEGTTGINDLSPEERERAILSQRGKNAAGIELPEYADDSQIGYDYAGDLISEEFATPEEAQYALAQDSAEGRAAQLAALQQMRELTDQSAGSTSALGRQKAEFDARQLAQSREGAIRQDAMRRGQVGGAADMISRQQAAQAAANQNLSGGLQSAQMAALQQLAGTQAGSQMAAQLRGQDQSMAFNNADTINKFNMYNTGARNAANAANTTLRNSDKGRNLDTRQGLSNKGTELDMTKLARGDRNVNSGFGAQMTKYGSIDDVLAAQLGQVDREVERKRRDRSEAGSVIKDTANAVGSAFGV
jgi:hypothetical protein